MVKLLGEGSSEVRARAERKRQALVAELCADAINVLLDDTGPLYALPRDIRAAIRGDLDSAVRTLEDAKDRAEAAAEEPETEAREPGLAARSGRFRVLKRTEAADSEAADKRHIVKTLVAVWKKEFDGGDVWNALKQAAYKLEGEGVSKMMLSSLLNEFTKHGKMGEVELISPTALARLKKHPKVSKELWVVQQYALDLKKEAGW